VRAPGMGAEEGKNVSAQAAAQLQDQVAQAGVRYGAFTVFGRSPSVTLTVRLSWPR
jgi:hypothetical protein